MPVLPSADPARGPQLCPLIPIVPTPAPPRKPADHPAGFRRSHGPGAAHPRIADVHPRKVGQGRREETQFLADGLPRTAGLGGRIPRGAARVTITKALKTTLGRIRALNRALDATIHTSTFCCYAPDPRARSPGTPDRRDQFPVPGRGTTVPCPVTPAL